MTARKVLATAGLVTAALVGGALGATLWGTANAATPTGTATTPPVPGRHSNEDPAHEKGESAARETAENNGTAGLGGRHGWNESSPHEAGESPAREAAENNGTARFGPPPPPPGSAPRI